MNKPFEGKPCPEPDNFPCIKCTWYQQESMSCKLGFIRESFTPKKYNDKDEEYDTEW